MDQFLQFYLSIVGIFFNSELEVYNKKYWYKKENVKILDFSKKKLKVFLKAR